MAGIRCFVAIEIPEDVRDALAELRLRFEHLTQNVRWTRPEGIHLTLKFLGDVPENLLGAIFDTLHAAVGQSPPFSVSVKGLGVFPNLRQARILWTGIQSTDGQLEHLAQCVEVAMSTVGFTREERPFKPHLTVGRVKSKPDSAFLQDYTQYEFEAGVIDVSQIVLMKSVLRPSGAVYTPLAKFKLN